jgi:hypothetical protein
MRLHKSALFFEQTERLSLGSPSPRCSGCPFAIHPAQRFEAKMQPDRFSWREAKSSSAYFAV